MLEFVAVFVGGGLGSIIRFGLSQFIPRGAGDIHWATFATNMVGALLIGFLFHMALKLEPHGALKAGMMAGLLGGLTTFSTFSLELLELLREERVMQAFLYGLLSLVLGLVACAAGWLLARQMVGP
jgi:crcB protein